MQTEYTSGRMGSGLETRRGGVFPLVLTQAQHCGRLTSFCPTPAIAVLLLWSSSSFSSSSPSLWFCFALKGVVLEGFPATHLLARALSSLSALNLRWWARFSLGRRAALTALAALLSFSSSSSLPARARVPPWATKAPRRTRSTPKERATSTRMRIGRSEQRWRAVLGCWVVWAAGEGAGEREGAETAELRRASHGCSE